MNKRVVYLDVLRILACLGVIANHTNIILKRAEIAIASVSHADLAGGVLLMVLCKSAVTLFLMISGALLLSKVDDYKKCFKRVFRVAVTLVVFSAGYYLIGDFNHGVIDFIKTVTGRNVTTAFWYLYMYLGILVMLPILQKMVSGMKRIDFIYFLFFALCVCSFSFVTEYNQHFSLPIFATMIGIFMLGYFLDRFVDIHNENFKYFVIAGILLFVMITGAVYIYTYKGISTGSPTAQRFLVYDNVFYVAISICLFLVVKYFARNIKENAGKVISYIGACTFGIYLFSDYIISMLMPYFEQMVEKTYGMMPVTIIVFDLCVFGIGFVITAILRMIPGIKKFL